jgi:hypothetical protein
MSDSNATQVIELEGEIDNANAKPLISNQNQSTNSINLGYFSTNTSNIYQMRNSTYIIHRTRIDFFTNRTFGVPYRTVLC